MRLTAPFFIGLLLFSCNTTKEVVIPKNPLVFGLTQPLRLSPGNNSVYASEFIPDIQKIDSITTSPGMQSTWQKGMDSFVILMREMALPLGSISLYAEGFRYVIPVKKTEKTSVSFVLKDPNKTYQKVQVKGTFNKWNPASLNLQYVKDHWEGSALVDRGRHEFVFVGDGKKEFPAPDQEKISNGMGGYNTLLSLENKKKRPFIFSSSFHSSVVKLSVQTESPLVRTIALFDNYPLVVKSNEKNLEIPIPSTEDSNIHFIRIWASDSFQIANDILIPIKNGKVVFNPLEIKGASMHSAWIYNPMIDRFHDGNSSNNSSLKDPNVLDKVNFFGGDVKGITEKIKSGYFKNLGINTLWISPVVLNPKTAYGQWPKPATKFSGYHGYWPVSSTLTDPRFCTEEELQECIKTAHENGIKILVDYVAHHIHVAHPLYTTHPDWYTSLYLPDGSKNTERWDDHRLTTWFDDFLPTFDFSKSEVLEAMTDSAVWWLEKYPIDGFRHDATKHIPESFWRLLNKKIKLKVAAKNPTHYMPFQIGETYGSPELIASYLGTGLLDAQFDFNLYDAAVSAFGSENGDMNQLAEVLKSGWNGYGYHHLMGNITGNQDRPRFISLADGSLIPGENFKQAGWDRNIEVKNPLAYAKLATLVSFMGAIPGIPVLYYGDEFGMPGANDPDNRRKMKFDQFLPEENVLLEKIKKLISFRLSHMELLYGDPYIAYTDKNVMVIERNYFGKRIAAVFNRSSKAQTIQITTMGAYNQSLFGSTFDYKTGKLNITIPPYSADYIYSYEKN